MKILSGPVDYTKTYFLHPTLAPIRGEPDYATLKILKKELKANASRVTSDLRVWAYVHLGLVLTPHEYSIFQQSSTLAQYTQDRLTFRQRLASTSQHA